MILKCVYPELYWYYMDSFWNHRFPGDSAHRDRNHRVAEAAAFCCRTGIEIFPCRMPKLQLDAIRVGSALLGRLPCPTPIPLERIGALRARVLSVHDMPAGSRPGYGGAQSGDLILKVHVAPKAGYERKGMDVYTTAQIPFTTAVFGGEAKVSTLYGDVVCRIPEGTQSGGKIRLRGKGIVSMQDASVRGDQYVTIQIQVPKAMSPEARMKLREFEQAMRQGRSRRKGSAA